MGKAVKMKKSTAVCCVLVMCLVILVAAFGVTAWIGSGDAKVVYRLPEGFISLDELQTVSDGRLSYIFWESQICIFEEEDKTGTYYQTSVRDKDFIVKFKGDYYINREK